MALDLKQTRFLQPLRSNTVHSTVQAAIEDIQAIQSTLATTTHSDGISVVARYWSVYDAETQTGSNAKSVLGIYSQKTDSFTYFVHDVDAIEKIIERVGDLEEAVGEGGSVEAQITNAINELNSEETGDGTFVDVTVKQEKGKITNVSVAETALNAKFEEIKTAIDEAESAAKAAATKVVLAEDGETQAHLGIASATGADGDITYTLSAKDIASQTDLDSAVGRISANESAIQTLNGDENTEGSVAKEVKDGVDALRTELLGEVSDTDAKTFAALNDKIESVESAAKSYSIVSVTGDELSALGTNVKEAWKLQETIGTASTLVGETIKIYKDSSLKSVELVEEKPVEGGESEKGQFLKFTYITFEGNDDIVYLNVSSFLAETEFKDGLQVNGSGEVSVKIDATSEGFLTVGEDGIKLSGVQTAINAAQSAGETAAKSYTDEKIDALDYTLEKQEGKAIVSISQTDGIIAAEYGDIAASHVTVSTINGITSTTVQDTLAELEGEITTLDAAAVKSIKVNNVEGSFANGAASVTIEGDDIVVSSEYGNAVTYPTLSNTAVTFTAVEGSNKVDAAIKKLDQNIATLVQEVLDNEEVTATALTKHNESCGFDENANYIVNESATYISGATSLAEADNLLDAAIKAEVSAREQAVGDLQDAIDDVRDAAISVVAGNGISVSGDDTEKTIAAVAKVDDSLIEVTGNGIGIKENGYIDCGTF